jgi:type I restriction enzyme, S subunit
MSEIARDWDDVSIADLGEIVGGGTPSRTMSSFWGGSIPWITPGEITVLKGKFVRETRERITAEGLAASAAKLLPVGSLLVTTRATLGEVAIAAMPVTTNQGFKSIIPNAETDSLFAYYLVGTLCQELERLASGTTFLEISKSDFIRIRTFRPKLKEQEGIAAILDALDNLIAKTEAVIEKLRQVRAGMVHDLLTYGLDDNGQLRNYSTESMRAISDGTSSFPEDWKTLRLRECLLEDPRNGIYKPPRQIGFGTLLVGQTCITNERSLDLSKARRAETSGAELDTFGLHEGDILVSRVFATIAGVGQPALVPRLREAAVYESNMMQLRVDRSVVDPRLLFEIMRTHRVRRAMASAAQLSNQASISQPSLNGIVIGVPKPEEQKAIIDQITALDNWLNNQEDELTKLRYLRSGLAMDLLSGRVSVPISSFAMETPA